MTKITPEILLKAYAAGVFPMAESADDDALYWIDPDFRGIIPLDDFHVPKRLARTVRAGKFDIRVDQDFKAVLAACSGAGPDRPSTWINRRIATLYSALFDMKSCHTVECWHDDTLVGGLYGVSLGGVFFGESMFSHMRDASKVALVHLAARLKAGGYLLLDAQFVTDHLQQFGAVEIAREAYHEKLEAALEARGDFYRFGGDDDGAGVLDLLQSVSQTS